MVRKGLKLLNGIYGWLVGTTLTAATVFAAYSLWDDAQVYQEAEAVQEQIRQMKPEVEVEGGPTFEDLSGVNHDIIGWLTVDGTNIDHPVLQAEDNLTYMNTDVYGNFSLAGSVFLDFRNDAGFKDYYSLVYGHNMDQHLMFGDLALFKDRKFFEEHTTATILTPTENQEMQVAAVLQLTAGTSEIFDPEMWEKGLDGFAVFLERESIWYHSDIIEAMKEAPNGYNVIALVTCSEGDTNDRTVLILARRRPPEYDDIGGSEPGPDSDGSMIPVAPPKKDGPDIEGSGPKQTGDSQKPFLWIGLIAGSLIFILLFEVIERKIRKKKDK